MGDQGHEAMLTKPGCSLALAFGPSLFYADREIEAQRTSLKTTQEIDSQDLNPRQSDDEGPFWFSVPDKEGARRYLFSWARES